MADPDGGESQDCGDSNSGVEGTGSGSSPESSSPGDHSAETADFQSIINALAPIQSWSSSTVSSLKAAVNGKYPEAAWHEESEWTERAINAILSINQGWNWQRLKRCSNAEYFSLPIHTIALLNDLFYSHAFDEVDARIEGGDYDAPLDIFPVGIDVIGYPIFRVDYGNEEQFQLYKLCWDRFLEKQFYRPEAVDREDITWYWVEDRLRLDGKGPREVQR
ncbi:Fc.00g095360.m01.CDS01 [Cosmosporella sp. VM-42]